MSVSLVEVMQMRWLDWRLWLVYTHRWLGIAGCVLFIAWFVSGVVMMYVRMPGLANEERLARLPVLDLSTATISAREAADLTGIAPDRVRVNMLGHRPAYRLSRGRREAIVFADTATIFDGVDVDDARDLARPFAPGYAGVPRHERYLTEPDQWTLQARAFLPMYRFTLDDTAGTRLYVSERTGDVVLRTTRAERIWAYLGPVLHWIYFTPLRRHGTVWSEFIIWTSLFGCVMCLTGLVWGVWRFSPIGRFRLKRVQSHSPYAGLMKWHHYAGLIFGVVTLTWTYSGLLSMGPFDWFSAPPPTQDQLHASSGGPLRVELLTLEGLREALAVVRATSFAPNELEILQFRGEPFWRAYEPPSNEEAAQWMHMAFWPRGPRRGLAQRYVSAVRPAQGTITEFGRDAMMDIARAAMPDVAMDDAAWLHDYDGYYYDARGARPLPVLRVRYRDPNRTWLYLDPGRGGIVDRSVKTTRLRRWLYHGLHSLDFPFLYYRRPLWDFVVIALSIGGVVLSAATVVPAVRRLRRHANGSLGRRIVATRQASSARAAFRARRARVSQMREDTVKH